MHGQPDGWQVDGVAAARRVPQGAAPAIALRAWILLTPAMFSGTVLAAYALAPTAGRTRLEATVIRRTKLRKVHALLERRGFLAMLAARLMPGVPATGLPYVAGVAPVGVPALAAILIAGTSIAVGAVTAAVLVRRLRTRCRHLSFA
ncbi:MAG: VTT domain-containing protein [Solirubrobacteraceae bacterium]